jgi:hypothetical protein
MRVPEKIDAMLESLTAEALDEMCPAWRERFAARCRFWADIAHPEEGTKAPAQIVAEAGAACAPVEPVMPAREAPIWPRAAHGPGGVGAYLAAPVPPELLRR